MITPDDFPFLLEASAHYLRHNPAPEAFLDWISLSGPSIAPGLASHIDPENDGIKGFFRALGVQIYNSMPLECAGFCPRPIPKPARNESCYCGSGRKFKHCCASMAEIPHQIPPVLLLDCMLSTYNNKELALLVNSKIDTESLANVAWNLFQDDEDRRVLALLEPWFKPEQKLGKQHMPLFDLLCDVYMELNHPIKRKRLVERVSQSTYKPLAAEGWARKASMDMDAGNDKAAWQSFAHAQKLDPDSPSLAILEMSLLWDEQRLDEMQGRARFWLARLRKIRTATPELLLYLEGIIEDPHNFLPPDYPEEMWD